ncbi:MAG: tRNA (adenosine(37)-N6)-threonylcarbamoyltransferase complex ATPase subunit type 1 TsaE [Opitutales bacterium]|nr:tRNA (adenosine(37)-N6)-threonylcarbamoyltransferase complex ATPase subunit type 1 TsaE [Opitutales bacterium]
MTILAQLRAGVATASAAETQALAGRLAAVLPPDSTLALHGNLGAGKTTFVQGLARGFGLTGPVTSPTFNLYTVHGPGRDRGAAGRTLVHLDAYRLETPGQVEDLLLEDFLVSPWCLAVEWPENIAAWLPSGTLHLDLDITPDERHTLRLR